MNDSNSWAAAQGTATGNSLALEVGRVVQSDGDYTTAIPADTPSQKRGDRADSLHLWSGLSVTVQGGKQAMLGNRIKKIADVRK